MKQRIIQTLRNNLTVVELEVIDKSYAHSGHLESNNSKDTHFEIILSAKELKGKNLVESHRMIKDLLKVEFERNGLHSLSIKILKNLPL